MTWTEQPQGWETWTPNVRQLCDIDNPTTAECDTLTGLTVHSARYTEINDCVYGVLNFSIDSTSNFGGTRGRLWFDLPVSKPIINMSHLGEGFWYAETTRRAGEIQLFGNFWGDQALMYVSKNVDDAWAKANISWQDRNSFFVNAARFSRNGTRYPTTSEGLKRIPNANDATGTSTPDTLHFSIQLHYQGPPA